MEIPLLGQQENLKPKLKGADEEGIVTDSPELLSQLLNLMDKARFAVAASAANMGCTEHKDEIVFSSCVEMVGLFIFARSIEEVSSNLVDDDKVLRNIMIELADRCGYNITMMTKYIFQLRGFSDKGKKRFIKDVKEFVLQTLAKNVQGFTMKIAAIIQS